MPTVSAAGEFEICPAGPWTPRWPMPEEVGSFESPSSPGGEVEPPDDPDGPGSASNAHAYQPPPFAAWDWFDPVVALDELQSSGWPAVALQPSGACHGGAPCRTPLVETGS